MKNKYKNLVIFLPCITVSSCNPENKVFTRKNSENAILEELQKAGINFEESELKEIGELLNSTIFTQKELNILHRTLRVRGKNIDLYDVHMAVKLIKLNCHYWTSMLFETGINFNLNDLAEIDKTLRTSHEYFLKNERYVYQYLKNLNSDKDLLLCANDVQTVLNKVSATFALKYNK